MLMKLQWVDDCISARSTKTFYSKLKISAAVLRLFVVSPMMMQCYICISSNSLVIKGSDDDRMIA